MNNDYRIRAAGSPFIFGTLILLLAGCGSAPAPTPSRAVASPRPSLTAEEFCSLGEYTRSDCKRMAAHEVWIGERADMVLSSEGVPPEIRQQGQKVEQWVYPTRVVYLKGGKLPRVLSIEVVTPR
jgi:hypothetical protein